MNLFRNRLILCLMGMMFIQYFALGAWIVSLAKYLDASIELGGLNFSPTQIAGIYSTFAIGGIIAPTFTGFLADRYFSAERLLMVLHGVMSVMMLILAWYCHSAAVKYWLMFGLMLVYCTCCMSSLTLTNVIGFRNLDEPKKQFGFIRLMGTFGWIVAGLILAATMNPVSTHPLLLSALSSLCMLAYCFVLPHTPPKGKGKPFAEVIGLPAIQLFRDRSFVVFAIVAFACNALNQFYTVFANRYIDSLHIPKSEAVLTLAQWCEMGCMAIVPFLLHRFGLKFVMLLGLLGWVLRNGFFWWGNVPLVIWLAIPMHGFSFAFFGMLGSIFVDREAPPHLRAGAQSLVMILTNGPAVLLGNSIAGHIVEINTVEKLTNWPAVWFGSVIGYILSFLFFAFLFKEPKETPAA